jgi:hypothetical protein
MGRAARSRSGAWEGPPHHPDQAGMEASGRSPAGRLPERAAAACRDRARRPELQCRGIATGSRLSLAQEPWSYPQRACGRTASEPRWADYAAPVAKLQAPEWRHPCSLGGGDMLPLVALGSCLCEKHGPGPPYRGNVARPQPSPHQTVVAPRAALATARSRACSPSNTWRRALAHRAPGTRRGTPAIKPTSRPSDSRPAVAAARSAGRARAGAIAPAPDASANPAMYVAMKCTRGE